MAVDLIQVEGLDDFVRALKTLDRETLRRLSLELKKVARLAASDARRRAPRRSGNLAKNIRVKQRRRLPIIIVPFDQIPYSKLFEFGGRHPVFGSENESRSSWTWVKQEARPFLGPAMQSQRPALLAGVRTALEGAKKQSGFQ